MLVTCNGGRLKARLNCIMLQGPSWSHEGVMNLSSLFNPVKLLLFELW